MDPTNPRFASAIGQLSTKNLAVNRYLVRNVFIQKLSLFASKTFTRFETNSISWFN